MTLVTSHHPKHLIVIFLLGGLVINRPAQAMDPDTCVLLLSATASTYVFQNLLPPPQLWFMGVSGAKLKWSQHPTLSRVYGHRKTSAGFMEVIYGLRTKLGSVILEGEGPLAMEINFLAGTEEESQVLRSEIYPGLPTDTRAEINLGKTESGEQALFIFLSRGSYQDNWRGSSQFFRDARKITVSVSAAKSPAKGHSFFRP